jgi:putative nucleotidyltransferase with HDIG domain
MTANLEVDEILEQAPEAVMLPSTATAILQKSSQPDTSAVEIADLLKSDQALSARVLKVANSAFYGLPRQIASIDNAVVLLVQKTIRNLVLTATMSGMGARGVAGYGIPRGGLFDHAIVVAQSAQALSTQTNRAVPAEAYTAGLLHDIGKVVLGEHVENWVGAVLAEKWGLPDFLVGAIRSHHAGLDRDESDETGTLTATCIIANEVARGTGSGVGINETPDPKLSGAVLEILGIKQNEFGDIEQMLLKNIEETMSLLGGGSDSNGDA